MISYLKESVKLLLLTKQIFLAFPMINFIFQKFSSC